MVSIELAVTIVATIMAGIVAVTNVINLIIKKQELKVHFRLHRASSHVQEPIESNNAIIVDHPDKVIERCRVFCNNVALPYGKSNGKPLYEQTIYAMGSEIFRIPIAIENEDAEIIVKDGNKRLRPPVKLKDVPLS